MKKQFSSEKQLRNGVLIKNRFKIIKFIGSGTFTITYLAEDTHCVNKTKYALQELYLRDWNVREIETQKVVYEINTKEREQNFLKFIKDVQTEMKILSEIESKYIVKAYGSVEDNGTIYSILEYIEGYTLIEIIQEDELRNNILKNTSVEDIFKTLLLGLKTLHDNGIIHRDISPNNIMYDKNSKTYKFIDFTSATELNEDLRTNTASATPYYESPEREDKKVKIQRLASIDIYSLGMIFYYLLVRKHPPRGSSRFLDDEEFKNNLKTSNTSQEFKEIITKMSELRRENRYQSVNDIIDTAQIDLSDIMENYKVDYEEQYNGLVSQIKHAVKVKKEKEKQLREAVLHMTTGIDSLKERLKRALDKCSN